MRSLIVQALRFYLTHLNEERIRNCKECAWDKRECSHHEDCPEKLLIMKLQATEALLAAYKQQQ